MTDWLSLLRDLNYISRNLYRDRLREYPNSRIALLRQSAPQLWWLLRGLRRLTLDPLTGLRPSGSRAQLLFSAYWGFVL
jgi:hypothetical protein